jgi:predicted aspartyl protease
MIGFDPNHNAQAVPVPAPNIPNRTFPALVDTGALESCIDSGLAMQLNLPIIDRRPISGVHGVGTVNVHLAQIVIPSLNFVLHGAFCAVDLIAGGQAHHALIGRTFLQNFTMVYEGRTGTVWLSDGQ